MKIILRLSGLIAFLLGGLWLLQGLGLVHLKPILCVANCTPIEGASPVWAIVGLVVAATGAFVIVHSFRRPPR